MLQHQPGSLGWVAIQHGSDRVDGSLNLLNLATGTNRSIPLPGRPGFFAETTKPGIVVVGLERRLMTCNLETGAVEDLGLSVSDDERVIINDGLAVDGGILFGTKHLKFELPIAGLYYFDSTARAIHEVLPGQICSNGKVLMRDSQGATLVDIDSRPKTIGHYRLDAGLKAVKEHRLLRDPDSLPGFPDGLRPAPDGKSVIVAFYNPDHTSDGLAQQFCLDTGAVLAEWKIPDSPRVTCPEFVDMNGRVMIVFTTAVEGMADETRAIAPGAGSMYIAETPFATTPAFPPLVAL